MCEKKETIRFMAEIASNKTIKHVPRLSIIDEQSVNNYKPQ